MLLTAIIPQCKTELLGKKVNDLHIDSYLIATVYFIVGVCQVEFSRA